MLGLRKGSHDPDSPARRQKTAVHGMLHQIGNIKGGNMNRKVYVANLPYQATEPGIKALLCKVRNVMSVKIV